MFQTRIDNPKIQIKYFIHQKEVKKVTCYIEKLKRTDIFLEVSFQGL